MDPEMKYKGIEELLDMVPMCTDCKWRKADLAGSDFAKCCHPRVINPGTGKGMYCDLERHYKHRPCGPSGKLFEPKEPLLPRLLPAVIVVGYLLGLAILVYVGVRR